MHGVVIEHDGQWHWRIYDGGDLIGASVKAHSSKEACRQQLRAIRGSSFLIYDEQGNVIAASWPF